MCLIVSIAHAFRLVKSIAPQHLDRAAQLQQRPLRITAAGLLIHERPHGIPRIMHFLFEPGLAAVMIWREDDQVAGKRVWMIQDMRLSGDLRPLRIRQDHDLRVDVYKRQGQACALAGRSALRFA